MTQPLEGGLYELLVTVALEARLAEIDGGLADLIQEEQARIAALIPAGLPAGVAIPSGPVDVTTVGGIVVNVVIAEQVAALLSHASSEGINLSGGGYRDPAQQIALRRSNCGSSSYAIYQMPASYCSPPTARPGTSNHERGLAIDFRYNGGGISSRSNPGYLWLAANAATYGLYNLPSEPWHWSVNGG